MVAVAALLVFLPVGRGTAASTMALAPVTDADGRLGLCDILPGAPTGSTTGWAQLAAAAGARVNRWELRWDRIEPQAGTWNFAADDPAVAASRAANIDVLGILIGTPEWAVAPGQRRGNGVPRALAPDPADPANLWADYVRAVVTHYRGQIEAWEIWNEPDLTYFWAGTSEDYARLVQVAYVVIKSVDPQAKVLLGGMVVPDFAFVRRVLTDLTPAGRARATSFDVASWHAYGPAHALYGNLTHFHALLAAAGRSEAPLWVTEDGFPASNPNGEPRQAAYVLQTVAYAFAAGASRVLVYRASDDTTSRAWGLMSAAGQTRMAYVAFQVAAHYLSHLDAAVYAPDTDVERFALYSGNRRLLMFWNRGLADRSVSLPADAGAAAVVDWQGTATPLIPVAGSLQITVPGAAYNVNVDPGGTVVGGPPVLVVEDNTPPAPPVSQQLVQPVQGPHRRVVVLNPSGEAAVVQVAAAAHAHERAVLHLAPHAIQPLDVDLLAGPAYRGMYAVTSNSPVRTVGAGGSGADTAGQIPAENWYLPAPTSDITIGSSSSTAVEAQIVVRGLQGWVRARRTVRLTPGARIEWHLVPPLLSLSPVIEVHASGPVVVPGAVSQLSSTWYAVRARRPLALYNPSGAAAQVRVRFWGAGALRSVQLIVAPRRTYLLAPQGARALTVDASQPLAAAYRGGDASPIAAARSEDALALAGKSRDVELFNPSRQVAHVSVTVVSSDGPRQIAALVQSAHTYRVSVRRGGASPAGALVQSDVPVVALLAP